ncbi:MAG: hypothetical protein EA396_08295 [Anaerolineaceae bacterium]|nr:MAG: hypothetical protein EA396_08295 [Anaerolineaceae bacterium]
MRIKFPRLLFIPPALIVVALFVTLPVLSVSQGGELLAGASGLQLALGDITPQADFTLRVTSGDYELLLIPALVLLALAVVFVSDDLMRGVYLGAVGAALIVWALYWLEIERDLGALARADVGFGLAYEVGWWLIGGVLALMSLMGLTFDSNRR